MNIINEDIWIQWDNGNFIVIPTNGYIKNDGTCVMGRGLAKDAMEQFPALPKQLAQRIKRYGNNVYIFTEYRIITFPVKHNWWEKADLNLIETSAKQLALLLKHNLSSLPTPIIIPQVGCGNGKLEWKNVEPILKKHLNKDFTLTILDEKAHLECFRYKRKSMVEAKQSV